MGTGDSVLQRDGAKKFGQKESNSVVLLASSTTNRTYLKLLCYIVKDKQCNASSAICPYNTGFGVWSDDGGIVYPGNALLNPSSIFKIYYLEMEEV